MAALARSQTEAAQKPVKPKPRTLEAITAALPTPHAAQRRFLETEADIAVFGGAAGGGKSAALLLAAARHAHVKGYTAQIFRRQLTQVTQQGGLWDKSAEFYGGLATSNSSSRRWNFASGASVAFAGLEYDKDKLDYQGAELAFIGFDEGTHFLETQFWYLYSRARTTCGVKPVIRIGTNPDPDSWLKTFIGWWIDEETGYAIPERDGVLRWIVRDGDHLVWFDTFDDARLKYPLEQYPKIVPKSVTFIASRLEDNPSLANTDYESNLNALPTVEREMLLHGNWKIRAAAGLVFPRGKIVIVDSAPARVLRTIRGWDFGGTTDFTAHMRLAKLDDGRYLIEHAAHFKGSSLTNDTALQNVARDDGRSVRIRIPQDPGEAGKTLARQRVGALSGHSVQAQVQTGSKGVRSSGLAAQWQAGNVLMLRGVWNDEVLAEFDAFPEGKHDDYVDAGSSAFNGFTAGMGSGLSELDEYDTGSRRI